jgi:hypothetical protein
VLGGPGGGAPMTVSGPSGFGSGISAAGDIDRDGYGDVIVGGYQNPRKAWLCRGSAQGLLAPVEIGDKGPMVAGGGDVNGDGYADAVIGSGAIYTFYLGGPSGLTGGPTIYPPAGASFQWIGGLDYGDLNGDGYADFVSGGEGRAFIYYGGPTGLPTTVSLTLTIPSDEPNYSLWSSYLSAGTDANHDGYFDLIIAGQDTENAYFYAGSSSGLSTTPSILHIAQAAAINISVIGTGDIDGDGYGDVFTAVPDYGDYLSIWFGDSNGLSDTSRRAGPTAPAGKTLTGAIW